MKTWMIPELQELDVKLTAKIPGCVEQNGFYDEENDYQFCSTYNMNDPNPPVES